MRNTAETVGRNVRIGLHGLFWSKAIKNMEQKRYERNADESGWRTNVNTALSPMEPMGLPTGMTPHQTAAPIPGKHTVTRMPHLQPPSFVDSGAFESKSTNAYNGGEKKDQESSSTKCSTKYCSQTYADHLVMTRGSSCGKQPCQS